MPLGNLLLDSCQTVHVGAATGFRCFYGTLDVKELGIKQLTLWFAENCFTNLANSSSGVTYQHKTDFIYKIILTDKLI